MNNTIWSENNHKFISYDKIKMEKPIIQRSYVGGILWQYINHAMESKLFLQIIKYIRNNKDRVTLLGIDNDKIDRDYDMYKIIMKHYNTNNINFFWAHNDHVGDLRLTYDDLLYIKNKNHKWSCGHYVKRKLKTDYCIVLSQAFIGENRFNGYCIGNNCNKRTFQLKYIYKNFEYSNNKKYISKKKYQLLTEYNEPLISFSNSYYKGNKYGIQKYIDTQIWNYILFWNKVNTLDPIYNYYHSN
jgi:hypothetical protein